MVKNPTGSPMTGHCTGLPSRSWTSRNVSILPGWQAPKWQVYVRSSMIICSPGIGLAVFRQMADRAAGTEISPRRAGGPPANIQKQCSARRCPPGEFAECARRCQTVPAGAIQRVDRSITELALFSCGVLAGMNIRVGGHFSGREQRRQTVKPASYVGTRYWIGREPESAVCFKARRNHKTKRVWGWKH
jgi:hypothetical protein